MDILNADLQLKTEAQSKKRAQGQDSDADATFHFIAFMPAKGQLWKFDGLERQPQALGGTILLILSFLYQDGTDFAF